MCHCWVPLLGALQGGIAGCHCSGEGDDQLWGVDVVPLLGAIVVCYMVGGAFFRYMDIIPKLVFAIFRILMRRSKYMVHETCFDHSC